MPGINQSSDSTESPESLRGGRKHKKTPEELLKEVLDENKKLDVSDPQIFNEYEENVGDFTSRVRVAMKEKKDKEVSEIEVDELTTHEIAKILALRARRLISERSRLNFLIKSTYPKVRTADDWESLLSKHIATLTLSEMEFYIKNIKRKKTLGYFLDQAGFTPEKVVPEEFPPLKMKEIFDDADTLGFTDTQKKFLTRIIEKFERYKSLPLTKDIKDLLFLYKGTSDKRKRELLASLDVTIPLSFALDYRLLNDNQVSQVFEKYFGRIYTSFEDENQKEEFRRLFLSQSPFVDEILVPFSDVGDVDMNLLFHDRSRLESVADSVLQRLNREEKMAESHQADILARATQEFSDEDDHQVAFRKYIQKKLASTQTGLPIEGIENLKAGSIIAYDYEPGKKQYFRLLQTHDEKGFPVDVNGGLSLGVVIEALPVEENYLHKGNRAELTYDAFYGFFEKHRSDARVLTDDQFQAILTKDKDKVGAEGKIYDARDIDGESLNNQNILARLDTIDTTGRRYGFEEGTYFSVKDTNGTEHVWKVLSVSAGGVKVLSPGGTIEDTLPYEFLADIIDADKIHRVSKIQSDEDLVSVLVEYADLREGAYIKDRELFQKNTNKDGEDSPEAIRVFEDKDGGHIRIDGITDGMVAFSEYEDLNDDETSEPEKGKKHKPKGRYKMKTLSYGSFIEYLKGNKLKASTKKPKGYKDVHNTHDHDSHDDHVHLHGSFWSRIGKMQTIGSMWKGLEMVWHSFEHTLEKGTKLDAARFAMKVSKFIPYDAVGAQIYADVVENSKEIIEKYKKKIGNLAGPAQRLKCIHIVHNKDSRPEEVMAAIQFMTGGYGHLYAEDIKEHQSVVTPENLEKKEPGYFAFLDAFILTTKMGDLVTWRKKAYDKIKPEFGDEKEPPEEMLLHALFKSIDGKYEEYPYAAAVLRAIGGPGGFEAGYKEGTKNAVQKGRDQTTGVNAQGRLNKAVGYLNTHEFYKGIGAMEQVAKKDKDPTFQALPFIWAVGGYAKYASHSAIQDIKNYAENGYSFHAYAFMKTESNSHVYRATVRLALQELVTSGKIPSKALGEFNTICDRIDHGPESAEVTEKKYAKVAPPAAMMQFWQKYQDKGLHDMLQGQDGWLATRAPENSTVASYAKTLSAVHGTNLADSNIISTDLGKDWYDEHGLGMSLIFHRNADGIHTLGHTLRKIKFTGSSRGARPMDKSHQERMWNYLIEMIQKNRDRARWYGNTVLQKKQYLFWRAEIINYLVQQLSPTGIDQSTIPSLINNFEYFRDLENIGIDPMSVYNDNIARANEESDYQAWLDGGRKQTSAVDIIGSVRGGVQRAAGSGAPKRDTTWTDPDTPSGHRNTNTSFDDESD